MNDENLNNAYVYVYLDPRKQGKFSYGDLILDFEPFYVGKGSIGDSKHKNYKRYEDHLNNAKAGNLKNSSNPYNFYKIKKILSEKKNPIIKIIIGFFFVSKSCFRI